MRIGVAYYPEHWPEDRWPVDARLMKEAGIDVVRLGEFAWARLEPKRGEFDLTWLDKAIGMLAAEGLEVIIGTPTAAPPPWLFARHPSMVPRDREGKDWFPGSRRHACLNNRPYRRYARRIVRELAKAFGQRPEVAGWQIDNELGCHGGGRCYCDECEQAFREWLMRRYGIIDRLNKLWGTVFWSQHFNDWHEIPAPRRTPAGCHPSLELDYKRFISATVRDFVAEQRDIIEQYSRGAQPITTNSIGLYLHQIDQFSLAGPQDVASADNYPVDGANVDAVALHLDLTRAMKPRAFWVLEQQAGATMIRAARGQPRPGQLRLWSFQAAARGAELICYFRWRTCAFAQEMHWYGMLDADGTARRRFAELKGTIAELRQKAGLWEGKAPDARVAMVLDYHSHWALEADSMAANINYLHQFYGLYGLLRRMGLALDIVPPDLDPAHYALLVAPMPVIGREETAKLWQNYVQDGGTLVVTAPAGYRTEHNTWLTTPPPGPLTLLLGVEVVEHDTFSGGAGNTVVFGDTAFPARSFCSVIELRGAEAVASYGEQYYRGRPAVTRKADGKGRAYFLGAIGSLELYTRVLEMACLDAGLERNAWSSETVEVVPLKAGSGEKPLAFVLNHSEEPVDLALPAGVSACDLLTGREFFTKVPLAGYGLVLLQG
jgi:beta-galactosidase